MARGAGEHIALEADGPYHFAANTLAPGGAMLARHRLLAARGWAVISVPSYVWNELADAARGAWLMQARLLRSPLGAVCLVSLPVRAPSAGAAHSEHMPPHRCGGVRALLVLCGPAERWASASGVRCRQSVARARRRRPLQHSRPAPRGPCPALRSWLPCSRRGACLRMPSAQRKLPALWT